MKRWKQVLLWAAAVFPLILTAMLWTRLPELMVVHWDVNGDVSYGSRWILLLLVAVNPLMLLLMKFLPKADPKQENYRKFESSYKAFQAAFILFMDMIMLLVLTEALRPGTFDVSKAVMLLSAVLLMVVGNMMPKFRQTFFMGIKNAWTLSNEQVWARTHRLGGRMFFAAGIVTLLCIFLPVRAGFLLMMAAVLAASLIPTVMSYIWFRRLSG